TLAQATPFVSRTASLPAARRAAWTSPSAWRWVAPCWRSCRAGQDGHRSSFLAFLSRLLCGTLEVVAGPDAAPNCDPYFNVWNLNGTINLSGNVMAFDQGFHGGLRVAVGDVDGNGHNQVIATAGPGGIAFVQVL